MKTWESLKFVLFISSDFISTVWQNDTSFPAAVKNSRITPEPQQMMEMTLFTTLSTAGSLDHHTHTHTHCVRSRWSQKGFLSSLIVWQFERFSLHSCEITAKTPKRSLMCKTWDFTGCRGEYHHSQSVRSHKVFLLGLSWLKGLIVASFLKIRSHLSS